MDYNDPFKWLTERRPIYTGTWAGKPAANAVPLYSRARITDYGADGFSDWYTNGTRWVRGALTIYNNGAINVSSSSATETALLTFAVKGGSLGPKGNVLFEWYQTHTNNAFSRTIRMRIGTGAFSTGHSLLWEQYASTTTQAAGRIGFRNTNSESAQAATGLPFSFGLGNTTGAPFTAAINTANDFNVSFSVVSDGTQSLSLSHAKATIFPGA